MTPYHFGYKIAAQVGPAPQPAPTPAPISRTPPQTSVPNYKAAPVPPKAQPTSNGNSNAKTLRHVHDLARQSYASGERPGAAVFAQQLHKLAPDHYGPKGKHPISVQELAGMPDDAYNQFLQGLDTNITQQEQSPQPKPQPRDPWGGWGK